MQNTAPAARKVASPSVRRRWLAIAFVMAFFGVGVMHWPLAYADVSLPSSILGPGLALVTLAAVLARIKGRASFILTTLLIGACAPAAIGARVVVDTAADPTSHNLWPFELVLGGMVSTACAAIGSLIALPWIRNNERR